ncbi:bleomycin hydrolase, partial [Kickxella alabastrina]
MTILRLGNTNSSPSSYARHFLTTASTSDKPEQTPAPTMVIQKGTQGITLSQLDSYKDEFDADIKNRLARLTISRESYSNALENRDVVVQHPPVFSHKLAIDAPITNQKVSGRCWIFAGLNMLRQSMMSEYKLEKLELSQPYLFFYDKLE